MIHSTAHTELLGESVTGLLPTQCYWRVSDCSTAYSPHCATGESVTVLQPTQCYRIVSDCSTAHTVLQESQ